MARILTPCLTLVAPVGMDQEQQATWAAAAFKALEGFSVGEIERGAKVAMRTADHPSKIVPTIVREIEALSDWGRDTRRKVEPIRPVAYLPEPPREAVTHEETQEIIRKAGLNLADTPDMSRPTRIAGGSDRPARIPTRADYIRMGVDPAALAEVASGDGSQYVLGEEAA